MRTPKVPAWRQFLRDNLSWMAVSLVLAFGIWIVATVQTNPVEQRTYPRAVVIEFLTDDNIILDGEPSSQTATVTIRAQQSVWDELRTDQINVVADLRGQGAGTYQDFDLEAWLDDGIAGRVVSVNPGDITVSLAALGTRRIPVDVDITREPPSGYFYPPPECRLTEVTALGPVEKLEGIRALARLNLGEDRAPVTREVNLFPVNENDRTVSGVTLEPARVECEVNIQQNEGVSEVIVNPVIEDLDDVPPGYIYVGWEVEPSTVVVTGIPRLLRQLGGVVQTQPISIAGATSTFERTVSLALPTGVYLTPPAQSVNVTVKIETVRGNRQYTEVPVEIVGLAPGLEADTLPTTVTVLAVGPRPLLEQLDAEDLRVTVNLANLGPGTYPLPATANIIVESLAQQVTPDTQLTVQPPEISVTITDPTPDTPTPTPATPLQLPGVNTPAPTATP